MKFTPFLIASALIAGSTAASFAQEARVAPGVPAPYAVRDLPNGDRSPAPIDRVTGGVGMNEITPPTLSQSRTGGPSGGNGEDTGG